MPSYFIFNEDISCEEVKMENRKPEKNKFIMDLELLNTYNEKGCPACGKKFSLGETVVVACGPWENGAQVIHENEAVFDRSSQSYVERGCFKEGKF